MNESRPPRGTGPYRGPPTQRRDKRERERDRQSAAPAAASSRPAPRPGTSPAELAEPRPPREQRIHGLNACLAAFARRPDELRKVWLLESRIHRLKDVLAHCVKQRIGYSVVGDEDLQKLAASSHHEGVVFAMMPAQELSLSAWLRDLPAGPALALWLDGVGNPHNLGAILRSAAHFGVAGLLLPKDSPLAISGAAARVAEGGAEVVPVVRLGRADNSLAQLQSAGFVAAATVVRGGQAVYDASLPERLLLVMGAEQTGVDPLLADATALRLGIPGTGAVESLNVASATSVFLAEWSRQRRT
ncbi:MAG TPA: TrmH family RNA methyltransferase [Arenimonas sp.]|nr:TrmH family RNA methyltransferase [Arenimonas sp.]